VADFVAGADLAERFYQDVIRAAVGPRTHSAALVGTGSDVLGFDTIRSTDHGWGPRMHLFVSEADVAEVASDVEAALPATFMGWPTRYGWDAVPVQSHVVVCELSAWLREHIGLDPREGMTTIDWLATPQQLFLQVTAGRVLHDPAGELAAVRSHLAWYPEEIWLWLLACQWRRLDQEEPFVGRTAEVGDELGSRILAARLARDLVRLCLLLERRYAPYSKWLGSFSQVDIATTLGPVLRAALAADGFRAREDALMEAFEIVAHRHNDAGITRPVAPEVRRFHGRPFRVIGSSRFVDACIDAMGDNDLRGVPLVGGIDQIVDSVDVLSHAQRARRLIILDVLSP
jgi:hypothetical protein